MSRVSRLALKVKELVAAWDSGGAAAAVEAARRCPCGCRFRHRHGSYKRGLFAGGEILELTIPRLYCPACRTTAAVLPAFLSRRSPYPTCFRQVAVWEYLTGRSGYRTVAARLKVAWELLWAWTDRLARRAKEALGLVETLLLRYESFSEPAKVGDLGVRARSEEKQEQLRAAVALFGQAFALWDAGYRRGRPWGRPSKLHLLSFVESCIAALS